MGLVVLVASLVLDDLISSFDLGPEWLSGTAIGAFLAAFGLVGGLVALASSPALGAAAGFAGGLSVSALAAWLTRSLSSGSSGSSFTGDALVGAVGTVVSRVPAGGMGEVSVTVKGHPVKMSARCDIELAPGTPVVVTASLSATLVAVERRVP